MEIHKHGAATYFALILHLGHCNPPVMNDSKVVVEGYLTGKEGSQITVRCRFGGSNQSESVISTCVFGGTWSPDPAEYLMCEGMHYNA